MTKRTIVVFKENMSQTPSLSSLIAHFRRLIYFFYLFNPFSDINDLIQIKSTHKFGSAKTETNVRANTNKDVSNRMNIPLPLIVLGAVALYGIVFLVVLSKLAGRNRGQMSLFGQRQDQAPSEDLPVATKRDKIVSLDARQFEEAKKQGKKVS